MLSFLNMLRRSLLLVAGLLAVDTVAGYLLTFLKYTFIEAMGDIMLVEVAALFILAGLLDFASSIGVTQFRKTFLASKQGYSSLKHKESERKALVFFLAGLILFLMLAVSAIYERI